MPFTPTEFAGLLVFEPRVFEDNRGYFFESYNEAVFHEAGVTMKWVQDNQARSTYGVVRGLHFQAPPYTQTKLIRALQGTILDVVVDIRKEQPTYGKVFSIELSAENKKQLLVPAGFAHGYSVLSETAEVMYKCDNLYNKGAEGGLLPTDPSLAIDWKIPAEAIVLSEKDQVYPTLSQLQSPF